MKTRIYNLTSLNLKVQPLLQEPGDLLRSVNVETKTFGSKDKRAGYITYLGTMPNGSVVQDMANFTKENGTQFWNYAFAGGKLYYSTQGTGAWTIAGNGTFSAAGTLTTAVLENTLYVCDGVGTINYSTTGTSFVNIGTTGQPAPVAVSLAQYHDRIYAAGSSSDVFWSTPGLGTDWSTDSSSVRFPGAGKVTSIFKQDDLLVVNKNSGNMFTWDEFNQVDLATELAPTSTRSIGDIEDSRFFLNRLGVYAYAGGRPKIISNAIERQIYNNSGSAITGTAFDNAAGVGHQGKYYLSVGTASDDLTGQTITNDVLRYDYQLNQWTNYSLAHNPTSWLSYRDTAGSQQLLFGAGSQVYQFAGTATADAGTAISTVQEGVINFGEPEVDKKFDFVWAFFNPGCQAVMQVAIADTFTRNKLQWQDLGDVTDGHKEFKFPSGSRGKLLLWRVTDSSATAGFRFYGLTVGWDRIERR